MASKDKLWPAHRARIHALKNKVMQMRPDYSDDNYRDLIHQVSNGRTDSSTGLTVAERIQLMDRLAELAGEAPSLTREGGGRVAYPNRPRNMETGDRAELLGKIEAQLAEAGRPWAYATGMARHMFKVDKIEWCTPEQLQKIVAALTYDARRHGRKER